MGPIAGLDGLKNLAATGIRSQDRPTCSSVAIPTELSGPQQYRKHVDIPNLLEETAYNGHSFPIYGIPCFLVPFVPYKNRTRHNFATSDSSLFNGPSLGKGHHYGSKINYRF